MTLNHKQEELLQQLIGEIEAKFPETKFVKAYSGIEGENSVWLDFTKPHDEDRLIEVGEYASERTTDILLDYGYHFVVLPVVQNGEHAALAL